MPGMGLLLCIFTVNVPVLQPIGKDGLTWRSGHALQLNPQLHVTLPAMLLHPAAPSKSWKAESISGVQRPRRHGWQRLQSFDIAYSM